MSLIMDFIQNAENAGRGMASAIADPFARLGNDVLGGADIVNALSADATGNQQASANAQAAAKSTMDKGGGLLHQGSVGQGRELSQGNSSLIVDPRSAEMLAGNSAEIASNFIGGGAAKDAVEAGVKTGGSKLAMDFIHGATAGATANSLYTTGSEAYNGQSINPGAIIEAAGVGAAAGGVLGTAIPAAVGGVKSLSDKLGEVGGINNPTGGLNRDISGATVPSDTVDPADLQKIANSDNPKEIAKILEPTTGPVVANNLAPSLAADTDVETVKNQIDQGVTSKLQPALDAQAQAIQQMPLTPSTPTSDVNTPGQVSQEAANAQLTPPSTGPIDGYSDSGTLVKDYADMIKGMEGGRTGGQLVTTDSNAPGSAYGGNTVRTTEHTPWYSRMYAEKGSAPSNADWLQEAEDQLRSGKAAYGASDTYKQLTAREQAQAASDALAAKQAPVQQVVANLKQEALNHKSADDFVDHVMTNKAYDPTQAKVGDNVTVDTSDRFGNKSQIQGQVVKISTTKNYVADTGVAVDHGVHQTTWLDIKQADGTIESVPASKIAGHRMWSNSDYNKTPQELRDIYNQAHQAQDAAGPQTSVQSPAEAKAASDAITQRLIAKGYMSIPEAGTEAPRLSTEEQSLNKLAPAPKNGLNEIGSLASKEPSADELAQQNPDINAAPAEPKDFMNSPKSLDELKNPNLKTHVGELNGVTEMHFVAKEGGTPVEAMDAYINETGATRAEAQAAWDKMYQDPNSGLPKGMVNAKLNPEFERASGLTPEVQKGDAEQPVKNVRTRVNEITRLQNESIPLIKQLSPEDMTLMDNAREKPLDQVIGQAQDKQAFTDAFNAVRKTDDFIQGSESGAMGGNVGYMQNHGIQMFYKQDENVEPGIASISRTPGQANPRNFGSYDEAAENGVERQNNNFLEDYIQATENAKSRLGQLEMEKGLNQAYPGQVQISRIGQGEEGLYKQLDIPYAGKLSMPAQIADEINKRAPAMDANGGWAKYDRLNGNWKNLKLAGGGFHSVNVMGSFAAHQILSGQFIKDHTALSDMVKVTLSQKSFDDYMTESERNGNLLNQEAGGLVGAKNTGLDASNVEGDIKPSGKILGNLPVIKQLHAAIFERQIPFMKMRIYDQLTKGMDRNVPEDLAKMTSIAKGLNNAFGGLNRDIQGISPAAFQKMSRLFLATDYNEGQIRTLGNAFTQGGPAGKLAREIVFGKAALFGGIATIGGLAGGEFKGQTPKQVALDIMDKVVNPSFKFKGYTLGLPTTQLSELGKPLSEVAGNIAGDMSGNPAESGKSLKSPIEDFASARLAAIPSGIEQFASNKNFYDQPIHGTDYYGRPISKMSTLANLLGDVAPIPATQAIQTKEGHESIGAAISNVVGLRATLTNNMDYSPIAAQYYIQQLEKGLQEKQPGITPAQVQADTQFVAALGAGDIGRSKVLKSAESIIASAQQSKDPKQIAAATPAVQKLMNEYNQQLAKALVPWAQSSGSKYMDSSMLELLRSTMITYKNAQSNVSYDLKTNPTAYGAAIQSLPTAPNVVGG